MVTVVLLAILFNSSTGEVLNAKGIGFETREQCTAAVALLAKTELPQGFKAYAKCVVPSDLAT